ncbi:MAG: HAD-IIA family hydrolase [Anaerolineae bacterium]|nr:HAD-IIA family hydrolase [Anaerolineae bacterium]MDW8101093.1 HAD-IIA family hydrolase [Anaerolineae bacterium]
MKALFSADLATRQRVKELAGFILDMDGTLYLGDTLLPGAAKLLASLQARHLPFLYLTNNSSRDAAMYAEKLNRLGLPATSDQILTSGAATAAWLRAYHPHTRLFVLGTPSLQAEFASAGFQVVDEAPDLVVLGFDTTLTYARLAQACTLIRQGVPWIATHPDINCPVPGGFIPDAGAIAAAIVASTGVQPQVVIGKPNPYIFQEALARLGTPAAATAMVGDRLYTDITGARRAGLVAILVLSGETTLADLETATTQPDMIFPSVCELAQVLDE